MMKFSVAACSLFISGFAVAVEGVAPLEKVYQCRGSGCSVACLDDSGRWITLSDDASDIVITQYPSGNVEYFLRRGVRGDESVIVSDDGLRCRVSNLR